MIRWELLWWWTGIGWTLYLICLIGTIKAHKVEHAYWWMMPTPVIALYAAGPMIVFIPSARAVFNWQVVAVIVSVAIIAMIPMSLYQRRSAKEGKRLKQKRIEDTDDFLRRLGV